MRLAAQSLDDAERSVAQFAWVGLAEVRGLRCGVGSCAPIELYQCHQRGIAGLGDEPGPGHARAVVAFLVLVHADGECVHPGQCKRMPFAGARAQRRGELRQETCPRVRLEPEMQKQGTGDLRCRNRGRNRGQAICAITL